MLLCCSVRSEYSLFLHGSKFNYLKVTLKPVTLSVGIDFSVPTVVIFCKKYIALKHFIRTYVTEKSLTGLLIHDKSIFQLI